MATERALKAAEINTAEMIHITVKTIDDRSCTFLISSACTIGELRQQLETRLKIPWTMIQIKNIFDENHQRLCSLFQNDPDQMLLTDFIKCETNKPDLKPKRLCLYVTTGDGRPHLRSPNSTSFISYWNPELSKSTELIVLLHPFNKTQYTRKKYEKMLVKGHNVNQSSQEDGATPFTQAFYFHGADEVELALMFGAKPYFDSRSKEYFLNSLHFAIKEKWYAKVNTVWCFLNPPDKPLRPGATESKHDNMITRIEYDKTNGAMRTLIHFRDRQKIEARMRRLDQLDATEINALFPIFCATYETPNSSIEALRAIFNEDFEKDKHKLVEIISISNSRNETQIIGLNLFEEITLKGEEHTRRLHLVHSLIDERYESMGFMAFLMYRNFCLLPIIFPDKKIKGRWEALTGQSYKSVARHAIHFPKHQAAHHLAEDKAVTKHIHDSDSVLHHDGTLNCYVQYAKPLRVKRYKYNHNDLTERLFYKYMMGGRDHSDRAVPIDAEITIDFVKSIHQFLLKYGIDITLEIPRYLPYAKQLFNPVPDNHLIPFVNYADRDKLFWKNVVKPAAEKMIRFGQLNPNNIRSKL